MAKNTKISLEIAMEQFEQWLEHKRIKNRKREQNKEQEELILEAMQEGNLVLNDDKSFTYKLEFPLGDKEGEPVLDSLTFKPRLKVFEINSKMKGVKATDADGRIVAYISAATGENGGLIKKLDTEDFNVAQALIMYFL